MCDGYAILPSKSLPINMETPHCPTHDMSSMSLPGVEFIMLHEKTII